MIRRLVLALCVLTSAAMTSTRAHSVWIEPVDGRLVVRFAEPDGKLETSPGYLDSLTVPRAFALITNSPVVVEATKRADHFHLVGASPTNVAGAESTFTVRGGRQPNFYARWQSAGSASVVPLMTLDLVPTGQAGEVRVYFRGQPLGGIKTTLRAPDGKESENVADGAGFVHFEANQPGQYLLTLAHHREPLAGYHRGVAYKETSHNAALSWQQP